MVLNERTRGGIGGIDPVRDGGLLPDRSCIDPLTQLRILRRDFPGPPELEADDR
ncbi:hypothetical protein [Halorubrum sp. DTA98]|uniref:hypothetical protein n=1 Tax=Halorubrum sp. DTA98 TaxID=3402163 RepID=UPI003AAC39CB